jgi:Transglutaminase-like superfamily
LAERIRLWLLLWRTYARVRAGIRRPLPELVADLQDPVAGERRQDPRRLSAGVHQAIRIGRRRPTCLMKSLVLFHLLRRQGDDAQLLIGLPANPVNQNAHAWVELDGRVVGPAPGSLGHQPLARYPDPLRR